VKWDINPEEKIYTYKDHCIRISFDTAWDPPTMAIARLSGMYPELTIILDFTRHNDNDRVVEVFLGGRRCLHMHVALDFGSEEGEVACPE